MARPAGARRPSFTGIRRTPEAWPAGRTGPPGRPGFPRALRCLRTGAPFPFDWIPAWPGTYRGLGQLFAWISQVRRVSNCRKFPVVYAAVLIGVSMYQRI